MNIILHIGTYKTGSSALQLALKTNKRQLLDRGIAYAHRPGAKNANYLAGFLIAGDTASVRRFFADNLAAAEKAGAHTLVVSGETMFGMSAFFRRIRNRPCPDYWASEREAVSRLKQSLPEGVPISIVCYLRRQDRFLESIYNQCVKGRRIGTSAAEFRSVIAECLDYAAHVDLWTSMFGTRNCLVRTYEATGNDIIGDFVENVLGLPRDIELEDRDLRINDRLGRDVLEFKRILNRLPVTRIEKDVQKRACKAISKAMGDNGLYHDYLTPEARAELLASAEPGNERLGTHYGLPKFPELDLAALRARPAYPGLTPDVAMEILARYEKIVGRQRVGLQTMARGTARFMRPLPLLKKLPLAARHFGLHRWLNRI